MVSVAGVSVIALQPSPASAAAGFSVVADRPRATGAVSAAPRSGGAVMTGTSWLLVVHRRVRPHRDRSHGPTERLTRSFPGATVSGMSRAPEPSFVQLLTEQVRHEFTASQQYIAIAVWFDGHDLPRLATHFYLQSVEERNHAM